MTPEGKYLVYIVEDDAVYLQTLNFFLKNKLGDKIETATFSNGENCVEALEGKPDIVVLDYHLDSDNDNAMTGLATLNAIKKQIPNITALMLSSQGSYGVAAQTIAGGAIHYITKGDGAADELVEMISGIVNA